MRIKLLYHILRVGNAIAFRVADMEYYDNGNARATVTYAWWYRPIVVLGFWLCGDTQNEQESQ